MPGANRLVTSLQTLTTANYLYYLTSKPRDLAILTHSAACLFARIDLGLCLADLGTVAECAREVQRIICRAVRC